MDDRRKEPSAADIKAEKELRHEHSLANAIEKVRAIRAQREAKNSVNNLQRLEDIMNAINSLRLEIGK